MSEDKSKGVQLPRAKHVTLTFYDKLVDYPYTSRFYVADDATREHVEGLIESVKALSMCVLGKYKIGYEAFVVPDYRERLKDISPYAMGTFKWRIVAQDNDFKKHSFTIPGRNPQLSRPSSKLPDLTLPVWEAFLQQFRALCLTKLGEELQEPIGVTISTSAYPPKGAKKRR